MKLKNILRNKFQLSVILIFIIAIFFRFYDFSARVHIVGDGARDVLASKAAAEINHLPQIGVFSAGLPLVYGPWYWQMLFIVHKIAPNFILAPWVFTTLLSLILVGLMIKIGTKIGNRSLGLIAGLFTAISPAQISNAFDVWQPTIIPLASGLAIYCLFTSIKKKTLFSSLGLGFFIGLITVTQLQGLMMWPLVLVLLIFTSSRIKHFLACLFGLIIALFPLIIFDLRHQFFELRNFLDYFLYGQYRIYIPHRWLTYISDFWPLHWTDVIGGHSYLFFVIATLAFILFLNQIITKKIKKAFLAFLLSLGIILIQLRYLRGEYHAYLILFLHPFIILVTSWVAYLIIKKNKLLGSILFTLIFLFTIAKTSQLLQPYKFSSPFYQRLKNQIYQQYPDSKYHIYGCIHGGGFQVSHATSLFLHYDNRTDINGLPIGLCSSDKSFTISLLEQQESFSGWFDADPQTIQRDTFEWWKHDPPVSQYNPTLEEFFKRLFSKKT